MYVYICTVYIYLYIWSVTSFLHTWLNDNQTVSAWKRRKCPSLCASTTSSSSTGSWKGKRVRGGALVSPSARFPYASVSSETTLTIPKTASMVTMGRRWSWLIWHRDAVLQHSTAAFPSKSLRNILEHRFWKSWYKGLEKDQTLIGMISAKFEDPWATLSRTYGI